MRQIQTASSNINCKFVLRNKAHSYQIKEQLEHMETDLNPGAEKMMLHYVEGAVP
jgi:hypothetical protein